ncbi:T-cell antigen CD7 [Microcaecilia unicolor]|uniref:T-cell antigen CD7-like n=1 Tax=Microcaecilia unicolor TaxID=1415580 RepID=A0A6P7YBN3_9AMPH|nr:T-cell antigen CD7-like [Microcaecilia unicolor]
MFFVVMSLTQSCSLLLFLLGFLSPIESKGAEINQSPNKIIVQKGGSVQITCSFTFEGRPVGVYLRRRLTESIIYIQNNGDKRFDRNHTEVSGIVNNFTVTLHQLQENDSDLYLCDGSIYTSVVQRIQGRGTLVIVTESKGAEINQSPNKIIVQKGGSVQITCSFTFEGRPVGVYLRRRLTESIIYIQNNGDKRFDRNHTEVSGIVNNFTVTLHQLQENDSDLYLCDGSIYTSVVQRIQGRGTLVIVTDFQQEWKSYLLIMLGVIILFLIGFLIFHAESLRMDVKHCYKPKKKTNQNLVYEDMSYSLKRNTKSNPTYYLAS